MELIYLYIEKFGGFIYQQGLCLSNNFDVNVSDKILTVRKKENPLKTFYGNKISNISVLVGKNGTGKTTILDILGMNRSERLEYKEDEYLMVYHLGEFEGEDLYCIEVTSNSGLHHMIKNTKEYADEDYDKSKVSIGKIYAYRNDVFVSKRQHFFDFKMNRGMLKSLIKFAYIGEKYRYSFRNSEYETGYYDEYIAKREKLAYSNVHKKYLVLLECVNKKIDAIECDKVEVGFSYEIDDGYEPNKKELENYMDLLDEIKENLYLFSDIRILQRKSDDLPKKEKYILKLYSKYIMEMIKIPLFDACNNEDGLSIDCDENELVEYATNIKACDSSEEIFGKAGEYKSELEHILKLATGLKTICKTNSIRYLKTLMRYINSRIYKKSEYEEYRYVEAFESIVDALDNIPEECFIGKVIKIKINNKNKSFTEKLLKVYCQYLDSESKEEYITNIESKFIIQFYMLSEGEERFIDILAKIKDSIDLENENGKLLIVLMDEPDQSLHPEWSRRFVDVISQVIDAFDFEGNIQIIMSTHSPYLLSDVLPSGVFLFDRKLEDRHLSIVNAEDEKFSGLGANIYDLMKNGFFMDNTVGEFSTKKIKYYMRKIQNICVESQTEIQEIECFIAKIGEPLIKNMMMKKLNEKIHQYTSIEKENELLKLISNEADRERVKKYLRTIGD